MGNALKLEGRKFGRLTVIARADVIQNGGTCWHCVCVCGVEKIIKGHNLVDGRTQSCGCLGRENQLKRVTKHGLSKTLRAKLLYNVISRARRDSIPCNLTIEDIPEIPSTCPALGIKLEVGQGKIWANSPTVDRIDPTLGYVRGNIQILSLKANVIKNNATPEEIQRVADFMAKQGPATRRLVAA